MKLLIVGFVYILFSLLYRKKYNPYWGLIFVFFVMALQSNVGGDYLSYLQAYYKAGEMNVTASNFRSESGWFYLTRFFCQFISFEGFIFIVSLFEYLILAKFIRRFVRQPFMFVAGLVFFFFMNMMLLQMKAIRQALAIEMLVASFILIDMKKPIFGATVAALTSTLHTSALLFMPMLVCFYFYKKFKWWQVELHIKEWLLPVILTTTYVIMIMNKFYVVDYLRPILMELDLWEREGYFSEMDQNTQNVLLYLYGGIAVFAFSYYLKFALGTDRFIVLMALVGQFAGDFFLGQGSLFRLPLYFSIFSIVAIPNVANYLYKKNYRILSWLFVLLCVGYAWRTFMPWVYRPQQDGFYTYSFIFE